MMFIPPARGILNLIRIGSCGKDLRNQGIGIERDSGYHVVKLLRWIRWRRLRWRCLGRNKSRDSSSDKDQQKQLQDVSLQTRRISHRASSKQLADGAPSIVRGL